MEVKESTEAEEEEDDEVSWLAKATAFLCCKTSGNIKIERNIKLDERPESQRSSIIEQSTQSVNNSLVNAAF